MKLVIAEKPSVAKTIAKVIGATKHNDGYLSGDGYAVSWCFGHLAELAQAESYNESYGKWKHSDLPAVLAFFCKFEFSMIKYSVLWAGMVTFWLSCLIVI